MNRATPRWLIWLGMPCVCVVGMLAARLVWEQTVWTWEHGPAMVGYALTHTWQGNALLYAAWGSLAWPFMVLVAAIDRRRIADRRLPVLLTAYCCAWLLMLVPYGTWQRLFIGRFSQAQAIALLVDAAGDGDLPTVQAVLASGIPVGVQGSSGTALHAAAAQGQVETMAYLIARGADVNAVDAHGASPMAYAQGARPGTAEARRLLADHGGILIQAHR